MTHSRIIHRVPTMSGLLILAAFSIYPRSLRASEPLVLHQETSVYSLGRQIHYLEDRDGRWTIEEVSSPQLANMFRKSQSNIPSFGYTTSVYWFYVDILNPNKESRQLLLELDYPPLDNMELYLPRQDGTWEKKMAGESFPYGNKEIRYYSFLFPLEIGPGQQQRIHLRIMTQSSMQIPLKLWTPEAFLEHAHDIQMIYGVYFGLLFCIFFYNLFLFFSIRDRSYLFYILYILGALLYQSGMRGLAQEIVWPTWTWWSNMAIPFGLLVAVLSALLFAREFLKLAQNQPLWNRASLVLATLSAIGLIATFFLPYMVITTFALVIALVSAAFILISASLAWRRGFKPARLYLAAWIAWILGGSFVAADRLGLLPKTPLTDNADLFGFALNAVLFSFALADRINVMKEEKDLAQARLRHAYDKLAEQDRLKSNFFTKVSHELRTPLSLILTPLERLLARDDASLTETARGRLRSMTVNTQRLLRLVNQLLEFSRLETGRTEVSFEPVDIRAFVAPIVQAFEPFASSKGIHLELQGPHDLPRVYVDPGMLDKILCNLLSNACKFTHGGGRVDVSLECTPKALSIVVRDTGIGFSKQDLSRVFERFHQLDRTTSHRYEGSGIGLALTKELVGLIGGTIDVVSEPGIGSTFTVSLPRGRDHIPSPELVRERDDAKTPLSRSSLAAATVMAAEAEVGHSVVGEIVTDRPTEGENEESRPLVIVVEDNSSMRDLVVEICRECFRTLQAADGIDGLRLIRQHHPELVILDVMMPRMDGYEMLAHLRSDPATAPIPVLLLTAKAGSEMKLEGLQSGADDYLSKPFDSRELLARSRNLVRLQQKERELRELNERLQQEVVGQAAELERARMLASFLPSDVVNLLVGAGDGDKQEAALSQKRLGLTVFQLELRGFDALLGHLDPEEMAALLNGYLSTMTEVAFEHGATIDRFIRDTIVGFFGAPTGVGPREDALRCVKMALQMWQRAAEIGREWEALFGHGSLSPTMVLASGFATVGIFGSSRRLEYTAIGGPVDEAAALSSNVEAGEVFCSQSTWGLIRESAEGQFFKTVDMPQYTRPIKIYRLAVPHR